jgi:hypothetical protein
MSGSEKRKFSGALAVCRELDLILPDSGAVRDAFSASVVNLKVPRFPESPSRNLEDGPAERSSPAPRSATIPPPPRHDSDVLRCIFNVERSFFGCQLGSCTPYDE